MKIQKIVPILIIVLLCCLLITPPSLAHSVGEIISEAKDFIDEGTNSGKTTINTSNLQQASDVLYNILLTIGVVVAVAVAAILGIKYMTGSVQAKAEVMQTLIPFVIGCFVVFGAFGIWKVVILLSGKLA